MPLGAYSTATAVLCWNKPTFDVTSAPYNRGIPAVLYQVNVSTEETKHRGHDFGGHGYGKGVSIFRITYMKASRNFVLVPREMQVGDYLRQSPPAEDLTLQALFDTSAADRSRSRTVLV